MQRLQANMVNIPCLPGYMNNAHAAEIFSQRGVMGSLPSPGPRSETLAFPELQIAAHPDCLRNKKLLACLRSASSKQPFWSRIWWTSQSSTLTNSNFMLPRRRPSTLSSAYPHHHDHMPASKPEGKAEFVPSILPPLPARWLTLETTGPWSNLQGTSQ